MQTGGVKRSARLNESTESGAHVPQYVWTVVKRTDLYLRSMRPLYFVSDLWINCLRSLKLKYSIACCLGRASSLSLLSIQDDFCMTKRSIKNLGIRYGARAMTTPSLLTCKDRVRLRARMSVYSMHLIVLHLPKAIASLT